MIKNGRLLFWVSLPVVAGALTVGFRSLQERWLTGQPTLECAPTVDLGERDPGEIAIGRIRIGNSGRGELILDQFRTSCSCAGVEREENGKFLRVEAVQVLPGNYTELTVRVGVGARLGESQLVLVSFRSNDPDRPFATVEVIVPRIRGGAYAVPSAVVFGTVPVGGQTVQVICLYDGGVPGRRVDKVHVTHPERFEARLVHVRPEESRELHETAGGLIARLEVTVRSERHGPLDGAIEVCLSGENRRPDVIPVAGEVVPRVACQPTLLVFPRRAGGRFVDSGQILLSTRDEKPIRVGVESQPAGVSVNIRPVAGREDQKWLHVEGRPAESRAPGKAQRSVIRLRVRAGGEETAVEVPILFTRNPS